MTAVVQPDLFGEEEAREEQHRRDQQPQTCAACGTTEPNLLLLRTNHGFRTPGRACTAQYLVANHITYYVRHPDPERLDERSALGRALRLDVDAIITTALEQPA